MRWGKLTEVDYYMNEKQKELARHALGLPNDKHTSYRNRFCIGAGGDGYAEWMEMVEKGWATRRLGPNWGGSDMFYLTLEGAKLALDRREHLAREDW